MKELKAAMEAEWFPWRDRQRGAEICAEEISEFKEYQERALGFAATGVILYEGRDACVRCQRGRGPIDGCYFGKVPVRGQEGHGVYRWVAACANCAYANKTCVALVRE